MFLVHEPTESLILRHADPLSLRDLLPDSRTLNHPEYNLAVHHTLAATKVLRNLGIEVPAPIRFQYDWPGRYTPYEHQIVMAEFQTLHQRCFNLSDMGSMKTNSALWAMDWLMKSGRIQKTLVLCPLSTVERVWQDDAFETLPHRRVAVLRGTRDRKLKLLEADADIYILNHDGICIKALNDAILRRPDIQLVVVDEAGMFRNASTQKHKMLARLCERHDLRVWMLTGTPCPNAPTDAWALAKIISPARVPKFFGRFKAETMLQVNQFRWVPKADAYTRAYDAMQPAVRFRKKDCISLPPVTVQDRSAKLTKEQQDAFKELKAKMVAEMATVKITAVNAADQIGKLRQILCGAIKDPTTGDYHPLDHTPRLETLLETIEQANAKVIVVCPFKGIIRLLAKELDPHHTVEIINGDVSPKDRDAIIKRFKQTPDPHVLLCHPKVMAHGLNLTEADMLIFYAPIHSNDEMQQVSERFNRAGQTRSMTIVRIGAHPLEWEIYRATDGKAAMQQSILDLYKKVVE